MTESEADSISEKALIFREKRLKSRYFVPVFCQIPIKSQTQRTNLKKSTKKSHREPFNRRAMAFLSVFIRHFGIFFVHPKYWFFHAVPKQRTNRSVLYLRTFHEPDLSEPTRSIYPFSLSSAIARSTVRWDFPML